MIYVINSATTKALKISAHKITVFQAVLFKDAAFKLMTIFNSTRTLESNKTLRPIRIKVADHALS